VAWSVVVLGRVGVVLGRVGAVLSTDMVTPQQAASS
jgi:hypothetical protein